ncbi:hypothetical protein D3C84_797620 [compost metagenome]
MRLGVTRRSLIAIKVIILILTPEAKAEIHSMTGTTLSKIESTIIMMAASSTKYKPGSIVIFCFLLNHRLVIDFFHFSNYNTYSFNIHNNDRFIS